MRPLSTHGDVMLAPQVEPSRFPSPASESHGKSPPRESLAKNKVPRPYALQLIVLGSSGGPLETSCTAFLVRSVAANWAPGSVVAVDAGVHLGAIAARLARSQIEVFNSGEAHVSRRVISGPFEGLVLPHERAGSNAAYICSNIIDTCLITHPHLDHINGLVVNTAAPPGPRPKKIVGLPRTINALKEHIFNGVIWPNLSDEDDGAGLITYVRLADAGCDLGVDYRMIGNDLVVKAFTVSHGRCKEKVKKYVRSPTEEAAEYDELDKVVRNEPVIYPRPAAPSPLSQDPDIFDQFYGISPRRRQSRRLRKQAPSPPPRGKDPSTRGPRSNISARRSQPHAAVQRPSASHHSPTSTSAAEAAVATAGTAPTDVSNGKSLKSSIPADKLPTGVDEPGHKGADRPSASQPSSPAQSGDSKPRCVVREARNDSTAFFIRDRETCREILIFGDVESDSQSFYPNNFKVWREAAPLIISGDLSHILIECSYSNAQDDSQLFGHLKPNFLMAELWTLGCAIEAERQEQGEMPEEVSAMPTFVKKRKLEQMEMEDPIGGELVHKSSLLSSIAQYLPVRPGVRHRGQVDPRLESGDPVAPLTRILQHPQEDPPYPRVFATWPLNGVTVVIIHIKDSLDDEQPRWHTVMEELAELESKMKTGVQFQIACPGMSLFM